jgi:hypothetical protein
MKNSLPIARRGPLWGALLAVLIGFLYFQASLSIPLVHDALGYYRIARQIWREGLFSKWELSDIRTWGYPTFLGGILRLAAMVGASERWLVFVVQMGAHIASVFALRVAMRRAKIEHWAAEAVFYTLLIHPFALIYPAYMLPESLSLSLGTCALACAIALLSGSRGQVAIAGVLGLICWLMIAVRPGSIYILPVLAVALTAVWFLRRPALSRMFTIAAVSLIGLSLPLTPQLRNNLVYYGRMTAAPAYTGGLQYSGVLWIKYATSIEPNRDPQVKYLNPFAAVQSPPAKNPIRWYVWYPGRGAVTLGLHVFNLLDQDLPLPYNLTLVPAYYPYVTTANLAVVALGLAGMGVIAASWRRRTPAERWTAALAVLMLTCHLGLHSVFSVEARYGVAALVVIYAFAAICSGWLIRTAQNRSRLIVGVFVLAFCTSGTWLSAWVRWQAPAIRAEIAERSSR